MAAAEKSSRARRPDDEGPPGDGVGERLIHESSWGEPDRRTPEQAEDDRQQAAAGAFGAVTGAAVGAVLGGPPGLVVGAATGTVRGVVAEELADKVGEHMKAKKSR